jgi:hypothetical protein
VALFIRLLVAASVPLVFVAQAAAVEPPGVGEEAKRNALWAGFQKAKPKDVGEIYAYGENPSLTTICFSTDRWMYLFSTKDGKVMDLTFMKVLPKINRITFREDKQLEKSGPGKGWFVLWADGKVEMQFLADK